MNILNIANAISTLFPKKTHITFINDRNGSLIQECIYTSGELLEGFNKHAVLKLKNDKWQIAKFSIISPGNYFSPRKILINLIPAEHLISNNKFLLPTIGNLDEINIKTNTRTENTILTIAAEDWLQLEFLSVDNIIPIREAMTIIENIINSADGNNHIGGYDSCYKRTQSYYVQLQIPFDTFCKSINASKTGEISFSNNHLIKNSFFIQSDSYIYYGVMNNKFITKLGVQGFDSVNEEFLSVLSNYEGLFQEVCKF